MKVSVESKFVVVANRLPVDRVIDPDGTASWRRSPGGLVTALEPVMQQPARAPGSAGRATRRRGSGAVRGRRHLRWSRSALVAAEIRASTTRASPTHALAALPRRRSPSREFHREWWDAYVAVNQRFAERAAAVAAEGADGLGAGLPAPARAGDAARRCAPTCAIGFFCTSRSRRPSCSSSCRGAARSSRACSAPTWSASSCSGAAPELRRALVRPAGRPQDAPRLGLPARRPGRCTPAAFPISIDVGGASRSWPAPSRVAGAGRRRSAATSATPRTSSSASTGSTTPRASTHRLRAFGELIAEGSLSVEDAVFVQVATPSRERVEQYRRPARRDRPARRAASTATSAASAARRSPTCTPPSPARRWPRSTVAADVMVVTPFRDGMNLVAKEYVACRFDDDGALVLSRVRRRRRRAAPGAS